MRIEGLGSESSLVGGGGGALGRGASAGKGGALGRGTPDDASGGMPHNGARGAERSGLPPTASTIPRPPSGGAEGHPAQGATLSAMQSTRGRWHIAQVWRITDTYEFSNSVCAPKEERKLLHVTKKRTMIRVNVRDLNNSILKIEASAWNTCDSL